MIPRLEEDCILGRIKGSFCFKSPYNKQGTTLTHIDSKWRETLITKWVFEYCGLKNPNDPTNISLSNIFLKKKYHKNIKAILGHYVQTCKGEYERLNIKYDIRLDCYLERTNINDKHRLLYVIKNI